MDKSTTVAPSMEPLNVFTYSQVAAAVNAAVPNSDNRKKNNGNQNSAHKVPKINNDGQRKGFSAKTKNDETVASAALNTLPDSIDDRCLRTDGRIQSAPPRPHMQPVHVCHERDTDVGECGWKKVTYGKNKRKSLGNTRPEPLRGTSRGSSHLRPATSVAFLFLSGLAPDTTTEQVCEYLTQNGLEGATCEKMHTRKEKYRSSLN